MEMELVQDRRKSLTEIHVLVLCHIIRRPIIVYRYRVREPSAEYPHSGPYTAVPNEEIPANDDTLQRNVRSRLTYLSCWGTKRCVLLVT